MKVGDTFSSYEEFTQKLSEYKKLVLNEYWIRDARTIVNQRKRSPASVENAKESLKYYYIVVTCKRGGRKFESKNKKKEKKLTRNCPTSKQDCPATIYLRMSQCQQNLIVKRVNECHNHKSSAAYFNSLPKKRNKVPVGVKKDICKRLKYRTLLSPLFEKNLKEKQTHDFSRVELLHQANINPKILTNHQKFKIMDEQCKIMSQMCSEVSTPVFYERLNYIKTIINKWSEGDSKLRSIGQGQDNGLTEENAECLPSTSTSGAESQGNECLPSTLTSDAVNQDKKCVPSTSTSVVGSQDNECLPSTPTSKVGRINPDSVDMPNKISLKDIKMPPKILKRGRPKGLGNTVIGLRTGKGISKNTLKSIEKGHQKDSILKCLKNIKEGFTNNNLDLEKYQEKSLNENHIEVMEEEYLDEEFLE